MLELLAHVEPMSLPVWAVLVLSAAMYPLGFMLGAPCSDCCQGCPNECSKCTPFYANADCDTLNTPIAVEISGGFDVVSDPDPGGYRVDLSGFPETDYCDSEFAASIASLSVFFRYGAFRNLDYCQCWSCVGEVTDIKVEGEFNDGGDIFFAGSAVVSASIPTDCSPQSIEFGPLRFVLNEGFSSFLENASYISTDLGDVNCYDEALEWADSIRQWLDDLDLIITVDTEGCECGACCTAGACKPDVPQAYCENDGQELAWYYDPDIGPGTWQGVGTDCDPNPCPQLGACCVDGECSQTLEANCTGTFQGENTSCDPDPCT